MTPKTQVAYLAARAILRDAGIQTFIIGVLEYTPDGMDIMTHATGTNDHQALLVCQMGRTVVGNFETATKAETDNKAKG